MTGAAFRSARVWPAEACRCLDIANFIPESESRIQRIEDLDGRDTAVAGRRQTGPRLTTTSLSAPSTPSKPARAIVGSSAPGSKARGTKAAILGELRCRAGHHRRQPERRIVGHAVRSFRRHALPGADQPLDGAALTAILGRASDAVGLQARLRKLSHGAGWTAPVPGSADAVARGMVIDLSLAGRHGQIPVDDILPMLAAAALAAVTCIAGLV